jgi:hypothetical protein
MSSRPDSYRDARLGPLQRLARKLRSILFYEHWMIGIVDQPIRNALLWDKAPPVRWIEAFDRKRYLADPFPWPGSADTLLCETYRTDSRVGSLVVLKLKDGAIADEMPVSLPLDGHLSFPTVFMADGQLYLMPESSACGSHLPPSSCCQRKICSRRAALDSGIR